MSIYFLLKHGDHIECVSHSVKAEHLGKVFKTGSLLGPHLLRALRTVVHVITI